MSRRPRGPAALLLALAWAAVLACAAVPAWAAAQAQPAEHVKVYPLSLTEFDASVEVVRGLLSPSGKLVEDRRNNRLIVSDRADVHERIAAALRRISVPLRNVRIKVTSNATAASTREDVALAGSVGAAVRVGEDPPPSAAEVRGDARRTRSRVSAQQELLVVNGGRATISVAELVPYRDWFWTWGGALGLWNATSGVSWREVGASMVVQPTVLAEDAIRVRLTPEFSYFLDRDRLETEVHQLTTEVVVSNGGELDLGSVPMRDREFLDRFLTGYDESGETRRVDLRLKATIE